MVDRFIAEGALCGLVGLPAARKTIIALNLAAAVCEGSPFMGRFAVTNSPERVFYLCPEMGLGQLAKRARHLGLDRHAQTRFFLQSGSIARGDEFGLTTLPDELLSGSLVVLDTASRFFEGDENSAEHAKRFADQLLRLKNGGATVLVLFHTPKSARAAQELTLESIRGSGAIGGILDCCWGTKLLEPDDSWGSLSFLTCTKQRDFEAPDFTATCDAESRCTFEGVVQKDSAAKPGRGGRYDKDGKEERALELARAALESDQNLSPRKLAAAVTAGGVKRGKDWASRVKPEILGTGVLVT